MENQNVRARSDPVAATAIREFERRHSVFRSAVRQVKGLIRALCEESGVKIHLIEGRAKDVASFVEKIERLGKRYTDPLQQVPDLAGLRVIVHSLSDIPKVSAVIDAHFDILESENKQAVLRPDQFGYLSVHKVFRLRKKHAALFEWTAYRDIRFETQIRTVLQHAWAVTSHQVQYKRREPVPPERQRRLAQIASMLEVADVQLQEVRDSCDGNSPAGVSEGWSVTQPESLRAGSLWNSAMTSAEREALRPMALLVCRKIIDGARRAGVPAIASDVTSSRSLASLWSAIEERLGVDLTMLLRRIEEDAETTFGLLRRELTTRLGVSEWRANDAQLLGAATLIALAEPQKHKLIAKGWPRGFLQAIGRVMNRVS